ncbi:MAG TPA: tetratricopeptide repeat protein [Terriglobia bacterium]|nr:tetratricopeptide repeat protein [Terriglobia bacterium]
MNAARSLAARVSWALTLVAYLLMLAGAGVCLGSGQPDAFSQGLRALKQNRFDLALQQLTVAEEHHPSDARVRNFRGIALAGLGRNADAEAEYRESIRLDPHQPEPYRNLGYLAWTTKRLTEAEKALSTALRLAPDDHFARYYLGRVELEEQHDAPAVDDLERTPELWPRDPDFLLALAAAQMTLHRDATALDKAGKLHLNDAQTVRYGSLLIEYQPERGLAVFRKLASECDAPWARFDLALAFLAAHRPADSIAQAEQLAHSKLSSPAPAWTLLGIAEARAGNPGRAVGAFREAARLAPGDEERWLDLTRELMAQDQYRDALDAVQQGLTSNPGSYALRLRLGAIDLGSGRYGEAESAFRDLIAHGEPLATTYVGLAQVLLRTGRAAEAVDELRAARQRLGDSMLLAYFLGIALDRAGETADSEQAFRDAVRLAPDNAEVRLALGKSELRLRQLEPAVADLKEVLRLDPSNRQAKRLLAQALTMQHDPVEAARYANEARPEPVPHTEALAEDDFFEPTWQYPPDSQAPEHSSY